MLKILEKYKQYVLVIGGSLLMVAFIMPSAMNQMRGDPNQRVVAYVGGEKVLAADYSLAYRELMAINKLAPALTNFLGIRDGDDLHWLLLSRDAERSGFVGGESDGELFLYGELVDIVARELGRARFGDFINQIYSNPSVRGPLMEEAQKAIPNFAAAVQREAHLTNAEFLQGLAKLRGSLRMVLAYQHAGRLSDRRLQFAGQEVRDAVRVDTAVIPAAKLIDQVAEPTEAQLAEHFAKYRAVKPNESDNGIGYYQPSRIKLAWILIDHLAIADSIKVDPVEANKRWRKDNPAKPAEEFSKDRAAIETQIRNEKVADIHAQIDKIWRAQVLAATRRLPADGEYRKLPADWAQTRPSLEAIARNIVDNIQSSSGITIPTPVIISRDANWLTPQDLSEIPGLSDATVTIGNARGRAWEFLFTVRELLPNMPKSPPLGVAVQAGVPIAEAHAQDSRENRYYFMVLDTRKEGPADSIDEIRDKVVKGYKTILAYDALVAKGPEYLSTAQKDGIQALVSQLEPDAQAPAASPDHVRFLSEILVTAQRAYGDDPRIQKDAFRDAARAIRAKLDPTKPIDQLGALDRTFMVPLPGSLALAVGQVAAVEPITVEELRMMGEGIIQQFQREEISKTASAAADGGPFSVASLRARLNFRPLETPKDQPKEAEVAKTADAPASGSSTSTSTAATPAPDPATPTPPAK